MQHKTFTIYPSPCSLSSSPFFFQLSAFQKIRGHHGTLLSFDHLSASRFKSWFSARKIVAWLISISSLSCHLFFFWWVAQHASQTGGANKVQSMHVLVPCPKSKYQVSEDQVSPPWNGISLQEKQHPLVIYVSSPEAFNTMTASGNGSIHQFGIENSPAIFLL